jgi:hypothetical protein
MDRMKVQCLVEGYKIKLEEHELLVFNCYKKNFLAGYKPVFKKVPGFWRPTDELKYFGNIH